MANSFDLIIFGGAGDLSRRKLLPALFSGLAAGHIAADSRIYLTSRKSMDGDKEDWLRATFEETPPAYKADCQETHALFAEMVVFQQINLREGGEDWQALADSLKPSQRPLVNFLAVPPSVFTSTCELLGEFGLNHAEARVVLEKPLGHDLASAIAINEDVARHFDERQVFRIDHYLGKEAVQNLLALRFSNILFEEIWSHRTVDNIQITIAENQGLTGRAEFYEGVGALKDMVQNHLLQLLCLVAMEPPARLDADGIREEKLKVLKALQPMTPEVIKKQVVRGQYEEGAMGGQAVPGYRDDLGLEADSNTESFVAIKTAIENWRWAGVPFYLRTGKRLPQRFAEISIQFRDVPHAIQPGWASTLKPNRFIIRLQPEDHLVFRMMIKDHGKTGDDLREVELNLDIATGGDVQRLGPYLRLILDASRGDQRLFVHRAEVEQAWRWIDQISGQFEAETLPLEGYTAGTWGPYEAHDLLRRDGREWYVGNAKKKAG